MYPLYLLGFLKAEEEYEVERSRHRCEDHYLFDRGQKELIPELRFKEDIYLQRKQRTDSLRLARQNLSDEITSMFYPLLKKLNPQVRKLHAIIGSTLTTEPRRAQRAKSHFSHTKVSTI